MGEAYNIADDQNYTIADVIHAIAFATGNKLYNLPLSIRMSKVTGIAKAFMPLARRAAIRRINNVKKKGKTPVFETFTISAYMDTIKEVKKFSDDFKFSNRKLRSTGYELLCPDYRYSVYETAEWYRARGYI